MKTKSHTKNSTYALKNACNKLDINSTLHIHTSLLEKP